MYKQTKKNTHTHTHTTSKHIQEEQQGGEPHRKTDRQEGKAKGRYYAHMPHAYCQGKTVIVVVGVVVVVVVFGIVVIITTSFIVVIIIITIIIVVLTFY